MRRRAGDHRTSIGGGPRGARRRGSTLVWTTIGLIVLLAFASLAVDWGRVQLVRGEMRMAADAAARHAAQTFINSGNSVTAARAAAVDSADDNTADGARPVVLDPAADVRFGTWDAGTKTFTAASGIAESSATAVQVTARRTAARGNAVSLPFARVIGRTSSDVTVSAVARINSRRPGIVGLDYISMSGSSGLGNVTKSYRSKAGAFGSGTTTYSRGHITSNGNITLAGTTNINGDARPGVGMTTSLSGNAAVTGSRTPLSRALSYPNPDAGNVATVNNNASISPSLINSARDMTVTTVLTLPGGTYYLDDLVVASNGVLNFSGPATLYMTGNLEVKGALNTSGNVASNLRVYGIGSHTVDLTSNSTSYMDVYAPTHAFKMSGSSILCGSVVAKSVTMSGSAQVIFDESLTVSLPAVSIVQ